MFGMLFDANEKQIVKLKKIVAEINLLGDEVAKMSDEEIRTQTLAWKNELHTLPQESLEKKLSEILPRAFALGREMSNRILHMRHYDVQLLAGIVLHQGKVAEQKTGEGKTLTATLPLYLNSLTGRGVHLVTPNDYLSRHGAGWMGPLYHALGISVAVIMSDQKSFVYDPNFQNTEFEDSYTIHFRPVTRAEAYKCDILYGTNHEFGFDYLRDSSAEKLDSIVQTNAVGDWGAHNFAVIDEVDNILIDFARTPLIIAGIDVESSQRYQEADKIIRQLSKDTDYDIDEKYKNVTLTDLGIRRIENMLGIKNLYEQDFEMVHLIEQSLKAHTLMHKDKDYVVKNGQVLIVDQFTGRILESNRFSEGLHQAIEVKEGVAVQSENKTMATISYQNYYRKYSKLAGMTGTAATEAEELYKIYKLEVVVIPTHKKVSRSDHNDVVYKTVNAKFKAVADEIEDCYNRGQPVLIGTTTIEKSEDLHSLLERRHIPHEILNAKNHEREAMIIAQAGRKHAVTIATNMAGRGVDIKLGGDPFNQAEFDEVAALGGLHVIGTERHESRRIDNQLRGRSGRQGDPGSSRFYVALNDELMRVFGGDAISSLMGKFGMAEDIPLEASLVSRAIENAQKKVEGLNFDTRKRLVERDDVMNIHRETVYKLRRRLLEMSEGISEHEDWFLSKLKEFANFDTNIWYERQSKVGAERWNLLIKVACLPVVDTLWMEHLVDMGQLQDGMNLIQYAQREPLVEYKSRAHERFEVLVTKIYTLIAERVLNMSENAGSLEISDTHKRRMDRVVYNAGKFESGVTDEARQYTQNNVSRNYSDRLKPVGNAQKVGRNDPCPCGSGKKYKHCHGK